MCSTSHLSGFISDRAVEIPSTKLVFSPVVAPRSRAAGSRAAATSDIRRDISSISETLPAKTTHSNSNGVFRREVFAVVQPDQTRRLDDVQAKCAVMPVKQYAKGEDSNSRKFVFRIALL